MKPSCPIISYLFALVVTLQIRKASAQCPPECTICTDVEVVCEGLGTVPPLQDIDGWPNIERISLTNGAISEIPRDYFNLSSLRSINLSNNRLESFNMDSLAYVTRLRTIDLTNNPIECNNNIDWLRKWEIFYPPGNEVTGSCTTGEDIHVYLSDKPANLVDIKFAEPSFVFDRACTEVTLPFVVIGTFTSDLEYRAFIRNPPRSAIISVVTEYITVPVGTNSSEVTIDVTNRGEDRSDVDTVVEVLAKYPVSYETQVLVRLLGSGAGAGCTAPKPVVVPTTPAPAVTTKPSVKPTTQLTVSDTKTMAPTVSTEPAPSPEPTSTPSTFPVVATTPTLAVTTQPSVKLTTLPNTKTMTPKCTESTPSSESYTPSSPSPPIWLIIVIILVAFIALGALLGWFIYKKCKTSNKTASDKPVGYEVVSGGDGKVYSDTTKDV